MLLIRTNTNHRIGESLARLDDGDYSASLEVVDSYLTSSTDEDIAASHSRGVAIGSVRGQQSGYDSGGDISSSGEFASFRDASSSPAWFNIRLPHAVASQQSVGSADYSDVSVMQSLRRMVEREEAWQKTKATYEDHLAQMAQHLQQQSLACKAAQAKLKSLGAAPDPVIDRYAATGTFPVSTGTELQSAESAESGSNNWWSTFLPAAGQPARITDSLPNSPLAGVLQYATVAGTGELVCLECIQACERVADAVLHGDFNARVRCTRCHSIDTAGDKEWPLTKPAGSTSQVSATTGQLTGTPMISHPVTHTQKLANRVNRMASLLSFVTHEIVGVARNDGIRGILGTQGNIDGLCGTWLELMNEVNTMTRIHTEQVRNIAHVCNSVANGDLSEKVSIDVNGEMAELKDTINGMVDQLSAFSFEVTRVSHAVGTEGVLGVTAEVPGVNGVWKLLTDNVNTMASNLTNQVRGISNVCKAVAAGDLTRTVQVEARGEMLELKETINTMVTRLDHMAVELTRVAVQVGIDGMLGGQANWFELDGTWKDLTDNVNRMADNLTRQVRDITSVTQAVARGDLTRKVEIPLNGEMAELKDTINTMVDQLSTFAAEVSRVAKEVGTDGQLGGQANVPDVDGTWKVLTDNVNTMADNLTNQVRDIANVTKAISAGDLTRKVQVPLNGEMGDLKTTINTMVDQLGTFASEVSRVAKEVGTDGKLGGQANVEGVDGTWKDLTDNVNKMATNLTNQVRDIATVTKAISAGDLTRKVEIPLNGEMGELKDTINQMVDQLSHFADEVTTVAIEVGLEGRLGAQARVVGVKGVWMDLTHNLNKMAYNITRQVRNIAEVTRAVAKGDLGKQVDIPCKGEMEFLKTTINDMVTRLKTFSSEVSRVAKEVGTDGQLGGQANVPDVEGTWKDLTDNVNKMADNLTNQVRDIATVTKAISAGDLTRKVRVPLNGEMDELKITINTMVDQLNTFAKEVSRVAKEVGTDGQLGGQANVEGVD
ncbi:hypothetical protein FBU59_001846, partial [Linderina macrospora]